MAIVSPSVLAMKTSMQEGANAPKLHTLMRAEASGKQNMAKEEADSIDEEHGLEDKEIDSYFGSALGRIGVLDKQKKLDKITKIKA